MAKFENKIIRAPIPARKGLENAMASIIKGHERRIEKLLSQSGISLEDVIKETEVEDELENVVETVQVETETVEATTTIENEEISEGKQKHGNGNRNGNGPKNSSPNSRHNR